MQLDILQAQRFLQRSGIDAWLLYSFRLSNPFIPLLLAPPADIHITRRWVLCIPANDPPLKIIHRLDASAFEWLPMDEIRYTTYEEWEDTLRWLVNRYPKVMTEYSPNNALPAVSVVDAGFLELLRKSNPEIQISSSADLLQYFTARWSTEQIAENRKTAKRLRRIILEAFRWLQNQLPSRTVTEYEVQQWLLEQFAQHHLITDHPPIVATTLNAADPHYIPTAERHAPIRHGDLLLIDAWAKADIADATYADLTWMGFVGETVPDHYAKIFSTLTRARDAAIHLLADRYHQGQPVYGYELDDAARNVIRQAGYAEFFIHRTGHNIHTEVHGPGANLDNFETHDHRQIIPETSFSIEPGIYIPGEFGMRTEIDIVIDAERVIHIFSDPIQQRIVPILNNQWEGDGT